jgi:hypothetical protein
VFSSTVNLTTARIVWYASLYIRTQKNQSNHRTYLTCSNNNKLAADSKQNSNGRFVDEMETNKNTMAE